MTQLQTIQSLGEALSWLEKEINWGVNPSELRHLVGRIGELYTAMYTNGRMADNVNQHGYDVVSKDGERISVKTTTIANGNGHITFNARTLNEVDRIVVLKFNTNEMELDILFDDIKENARKLMHLSKENKYQISLSKFNLKTFSDKNLKRINVIKTVFFKKWKISELENGSIIVHTNELLEKMTLPILRNIAKELNIPIVNGNGNMYNTRQLGGVVIKSLISNNK